jgi:hypothetical protein
MKKASFATTLTKILFVLIVLIILYISGGKILWDAGKSALGIFGLINFTEVDYSQLNTDAKSSFEILTKNIEKCKNSKDTDCLCFDISLDGFNEIHSLEINNNEIKLVNIKDDNKITMAKKEIKNFNCYYIMNNAKALSENPVIINFDGDLPKIEKKSYFKVPFKSHIKFFKNPAIYKSTDTCLVSTDFNLEKIKKYCKI